MKKNVFYIYFSILVILLFFVVFYMLFIHVPYYNHQKDINEKITKIIETNGYNYLDYSNEYRGYQTLYIAKVEKDGIFRYVAYDDKLVFIDEFIGEPVHENSIKLKIKDKYGFEPEKVEIGYENETFVYYATYQDKESLLYVYYGIEDGEFIKSVGIGE